MRITDTFVEKQIIASIVYGDEDVAMSNGIIASSKLEVDSFDDYQMRALFTEIKSMVLDRLSPDLVHIMNRVEDKDILSSLATTATTNDITKLCEQQRAYHSGRKLLSATHSSNNILNGQLDSLDKISEIKGDLMRVALDSIDESKDEGYLGEYVSEWVDETQKMMERVETRGVTSGLPQIDNVLGGLGGGDVVVIGGRSGMGKSSLLMTMVAKQIMQGLKPAVFSFELGRKELVDKLISILSEFDGDGHTVPFMSIYNPSGNFGGSGLNGKDLKRVQYIIAKYLHKSKVFFRGASRLTVEGIMATARRLKSEGNIDELCVDHLGLLVQDKNQERQELSHITNSLKLFGVELDIPVVEVVQLNRGADTASEKPRLSHLKGSGSIEEDANIVLMPWRPYAIKNEGEPSESEVILAKSRNSGTGCFPTYFSTLTTSFIESNRPSETIEVPEGF